MNEETNRGKLTVSNKLGVFLHNNNKTEKKSEKKSKKNEQIDNDNIYIKFDENNPISSKNKSFTSENKNSKSKQLFLVEESELHPDEAINILGTALLQKKNALKQEKDENILNNFISEKFKKKVAIAGNSINLEEKDDENRTIIHRACYQIRLEIIKSIKDKLTKDLVNSLDIYGNTPLILVCKLPTKLGSKERTEIIKILLENKANIYVVEPINSWSALHWASYNGDLLAVKELIRNGGLFFQPTKDGFFPLDLCGRKKYYSVVKFYIYLNTLFLQRIGEYELLVASSLGLEYIEKKLNPDNDALDGAYNKFLSGIKSLKDKEKEIENEENKKEEDEENENEKEKKINEKLITSLSGDEDALNTEENEDELKDIIENNIKKSLYELSTFHQTLMVRLYSEHCLFWACYYNLDGKIINNYLINFNTKPFFKIYCMHEQTSLHAACSQGSLTPFILVYNKYNEYIKITNVKTIMITAEKKENQKNIITIGYPEEYDDFVYRLKNDKQYQYYNYSFREYLEKYMKFLIYPKSFQYTENFGNLKDDYGNIPFNLAAKYSHEEFLLNITKNIITEKIDEFLSSTDNFNLCGYYYLKDNEIQKEFILNSGKKVYDIPQVVLELNKNKSTFSSINLIMKIVLSENLRVALMEHHKKDKVFLLIDIDEKEFFEGAEKEKMEMKLLDKNLRLPFENTRDFINRVEPFLSRQFQTIINKVLMNLLDIDMLKSQKILTSIIYMHKPNVTQNIFNNIIKKKWWLIKPNPLTNFSNYVTEGKKIIYLDNDLLYRYFGESIAMFYSFFGFFTCYYSFIAFVGLVYTFIYRSSLFLSDDMYPIYSIIFSLWNIYFIIRWKRKESEIQHKWGMRMSEEEQQIRLEYKGDEYCKDIDITISKHTKSFSSLKNFLITFPFILILWAGNVLVFYYTTRWENNLDFRTPIYIYYLPTIVRSIGLYLISYLYDVIAWKSNNFENYKYQEVYDKVLIVKIFSFRLISDLTAVIYSSLVQKEIDRLKTLLYTNIIVKYLCEIGMKFFLPIFMNRFLKNTYFEKINKNGQYYYEDEDEKKNLVSVYDSKKTMNKVLPKNINEDNQNKNNNNIKTNNNSDFIENNNNNYNNSETKNLKNENNEISKNSEENMNNLELLSYKVINTNFYKKVNLIYGKLNGGEDKKNKEYNNLSPDFIEIQTMLEDKQSLVYEYADILIVHALNSLFSVILPFGPLIVFVFSIVSQNAKLYIDVFYKKRQLSENSKGIGLWINILEISYVLSVVFNSFLLYFYGINFFTENKISTLTDGISLGTGEDSLFYIVIAEHGIILLYFFMNNIMYLKPAWVRKERESLIDYYKLINNEKIVKQNYIMNNKLKDIEKEFYKQLNLMESELNIKNSKIEQYEKIIDDFKNQLMLKEDQLLNSNQTLRNLINRSKNLSQNDNQNFNYPRIRKIYIDENNEKNIKVERNENFNNDIIKTLFLSEERAKSFIDVQFDEILQKIVKELLHEKIQNNQIHYDTNSIKRVYLISLLKDTFDKIEYDIMSKKFHILLSNIKYPMISCETCLNERAIFKCETCDEIYCLNCKNLHISNELWKNHNLTLLNIPEIYNNNSIANKDRPNISYNFLKMEKYSFPTSMASNLGFDNLYELFNVLYNEYIIKNGITRDNIISSKIYIQLKMEFITKLETVPKRAIEELIYELIVNNVFNYFEIYLINRIAFKNFKYYGGKTNIDNLYFSLKKFQTTTYEERLLFLLNILDIYDTKIIIKNEIENFLLFVCYQSYEQNYNIKNILNLIFFTEQYKSLEEVYKTILNDEKLTSIFKYLLDNKN